MNRNNRRRVHALVAVCAALVLGAIMSRASQAASGAVRKDLLFSWNDIGRKLGDMAADFPDDKYEWKATPQVRSFAEQLLHAAGYANYVAEVAKGRRPKEEDPPRASFKSKAAIVAYVKKAYADGAKAIEATSDEQLQSTIQVGRWMPTLHGLWDTAVEHSGEHYGQLVVYYRLNQMIPPESRPRK